MILLVHILFGAAIGSIIKIPVLAIFLAFLGHYFLDIFPHIEYAIPNIKNKNWKKSLPDFVKVFLDFMLGLLLIFIFSKNYLLIYICALIAVVPDGLTLVTSIFPKFLTTHHKIHTENIHYLTKQKNFPKLWKISTQILVIIISLILLKY